jgi:16S rRNA (guanine966-N2)-methyltransferase
MPKGIRPTQEKVRKAIFDILGDIQGLSFLELFAGSGAVGFEAVSRGAKGLVLVEKYAHCLHVLNATIVLFGQTPCSIYPYDVERALALLYREKKRFDVVFMDPPYPKRGEESLAKKTLQLLGAYDIVASSGLVISQHFKKDNLPDSAGDLQLFRQSKYADTLISFYRNSR